MIPLSSFCKIFLLKCFHVQKSPGCITSGLFQELGGDTFAIIETWETEAACDEDAAGDHVQVSSDWWRAGHVTPVLLSHWCRASSRRWATRSPGT